MTSNSLKSREFSANIDAESLEISATESGNVILEIRTKGYYTNFVLAPQIIEVNRLDTPECEPRLWAVLNARRPRVTVERLLA